jgi:hypothetical protein
MVAVFEILVRADIESEDACSLNNRADGLGGFRWV